MTHETQRLRDTARDAQNAANNLNDAAKLIENLVAERGQFKENAERFKVERDQARDICEFYKSAPCGYCGVSRP